MFINNYVAGMIHIYTYVYAHTPKMFNSHSKHLMRFYFIFILRGENGLVLRFDQKYKNNK